ncbi:MAG TPA: hypothetical protein VFM95_08790, partial [Microcella sp.]|nr:hypothetical protein [Microcella sp.]
RKRAARGGGQVTTQNSQGGRGRVRRSATPRTDAAPHRADAHRHTDSPAAPRTRQGSRRASAPAGGNSGQGGIRVGQVVRSNSTGGQRRGR